MIRTRREPRKRRTLDDIFAEEDALGLLDVGAVRASAPTADQRLLASLKAIEAFISKAGREPDRDADDLAEATLAAQLGGIRGNPEHVAALADFDAHGLLEAAEAGRVDPEDVEAPASTPVPPTGESSSAPPLKHPQQEAVAAEAVTSLEDIWASDALGLLSGADESVNSIFDLEHVPEFEHKDLPDEVAQRTPCDDFYRFESLFQSVRQELRSSDAEAVRFQMESQIAEGEMFIHHGMVCIVDQVGEESIGAGSKFNPRLRVVYDNGTESNLLLRSLARALYKDEVGRRILRPDSTFDAMQGITHHDKRTGMIYILRSLSQDPALRGIRNLHKIGYTEKDLKQRLAGAERQQTYLEAPVKEVASFDCYNLDPQRFERLVHAMLHHQRVNVTLHSRDGGTYRPREWFDVELDTARQVVTRIVDGSIAKYRMDNTIGRLVLKKGGE